LEGPDYPCERAVSCAKMVELIEMPFGMWTLVGWRNHVLGGVQIPTHEGAIFRVKTGQPRTCLDMSSGRYTQSDSAGGSTSTVQVPTGMHKMAGTLLQPGEYD